MVAPGTPAPAVVRAAALLRAIAAADGAAPNATELSTALDAPRSSTMNILAALTEAGLVRRTGSGFALGSGLVGLASSFLRLDQPVQRFHGLASTLPALSQETAQLAVLDGAYVLYLARHDGKQPIALTSAIGSRLPATSTALGKAALSMMDDAAVEALVGRDLPRLTARSHATLGGLLEDLAATRSRGYAIDDEEAAPNVVCIGMPVPARAGGGVAAVSTTLFKDRFLPKLQASLIEDLRSLADYLSSP